METLTIQFFYNMEGINTSRNLICLINNYVTDTTPILNAFNLTKLHCLKFRNENSMEVEIHPVGKKICLVPSTTNYEVIGESVQCTAAQQIKTLNSKRATIKFINKQGTTEIKKSLYLKMDNFEINSKMIESIFNNTFKLFGLKYLENSEEIIVPVVDEKICLKEEIMCYEILVIDNFNINPPNWASGDWFSMVKNTHKNFKNYFYFKLKNE